MKYMHNAHRFMPWFTTLLAACIICAPGNAWATQEHADPEGLYSHQIAHIFFMFSMIVLAFQAWRTKPLHKGWRLIGLSAISFLLWNITTFSVHWIRETINPKIFSGSARNWTQMIDLTGCGAQLLYAGKIFDHIFLFSSILIFILGLRKLTGTDGIWDK